MFYRWLYIAQGRSLVLFCGIAKPVSKLSRNLKNSLAASTQPRDAGEPGMEGQRKAFVTVIKGADESTHNQRGRPIHIRPTGHSSNVKGLMQSSRTNHLPIDTIASPASILRSVGIEVPILAAMEFMAVPSTLAGDAQKGTERLRRQHRGVSKDFKRWGTPRHERKFSH
jgi:hypothetical protein